MTAYRDYWLPPTKWQAILWLGERYPADIGKFKRMKLKQLQVVIIGVINKFKNEVTK